VKRSPVFYWILATIMAAIAIVAAFHFDEAVRTWVAQHQNRSVNNFMHQVSRFGNWPEHFLVGLVLAAVAWRRGSKKWTRIFLSMLIALSIAGLAGRAIKVTTGRARPSVRSEQAWNGIEFSSKFHAFPSGHVASSTAFLVVLLFANWRIGLACLPIPVLIGFARIYIGAHYLSDVVCAAVLGILSAVFVWRWLIPKMENRKPATAS
jgi:membrane-associated phospholipid phosphatase